METFQLQCKRIRQTLEAIHQKKDRLFDTIESYIEHITLQNNEWPETEQPTKLNLEDYKRNLSECITSLDVKKKEINDGIFLTQQSHAPLLNKAGDANRKMNKSIRKHTKRRDDVSRSLDSPDIERHKPKASSNENLEDLSDRLDYFLGEFQLQREIERLKIQELEDIVRGLRNKEQVENLNKSYNSLTHTLGELRNEFYGLEARVIGLEDKVEDVSCIITELEIQQENQIKADEEFMKSLQEINTGLDCENEKIPEIEGWFGRSNEEDATCEIGENELQVEGKDDRSFVPGNQDSAWETTQILTGTDDGPIASPEFDSVKIMHGIDIIGFSARVPQECLTNISQTCFCEVVSNLGNHYTPSSGTFSAPVDGVYLVGLTHKQGGENDVVLKLIHETRTPNRDWQTLHIMGETWTSWQNTSSSCVILLRMLKGDKLFLRPDDNNSQITSPSTFSCYLICKH